jgi:hypothetical protein
MPVLDDRAHHVWGWFCQLEMARQVGMGRSPITYEAIAAYFRLIGETPLPWEVRAIRAIDDAVLAEIAKGKNNG